MYHKPDVLAGRKSRTNTPANLEDKDELWNAIVDKVAGLSLTKSMMHMHMDWDVHLGVVEKKTGTSIKQHPVPVLYDDKFIDKKSHSPILDTINKRCTPTNARHPARNSSLHYTVIERNRKRKAESLEEAGDEANADNAKRFKTVSDGAVPRPHSTPDDASRDHMKLPQDIPEVQFAGYNAEMLHAPTVIRQHTIGMLNEGQCQGFFLCAAANDISQTNTCTFGGLITRAQSGQRP